MQIDTYEYMQGGEEGRQERREEREERGERGERENRKDIREKRGKRGRRRIGRIQERRESKGGRQLEERYFMYLSWIPSFPLLSPIKSLSLTRLLAYSPLFEAKGQPWFATMTVPELQVQDLQVPTKQLLYFFVSLLYISTHSLHYLSSYSTYFYLLSLSIAIFTSKYLPTNSLYQSIPGSTAQLNIVG